MDYLVGFIVGYFVKKSLGWLDVISTPKVPDHFKEEDWDWIV